MPNETSDERVYGLTEHECNLLDLIGASWLYLPDEDSRRRRGYVDEITIRVETEDDAPTPDGQEGGVA